MGTELKTWQIVDGKLHPITTSLKDEGRTEPYDLEPWIQSNAEILGSDIVIIGRQIPSKSGPIDLLGIDKDGNVVVVELKRKNLPREALAQAIDYASDVAQWNIEKLGEICLEYTEKSFEETFTDSFSDVDIENLNINDTQRIILVGFEIESSLERMIEWLSNNFDVNINAIVLSYSKTISGEELLTKTSIFSEELEKERVKKKKKLKSSMSDDPGVYESEDLYKLLREYLSRPRVTNQRIKDVLLPALLKLKTVTREQLKKELLEYDSTLDTAKAGIYLSTLSSQMGMKKNDFLRQVVSYEYPNNAWEKDNFSLREEYRELLKKILEELPVETE